MWMPSRGSLRLPSDRFFRSALFPLIVVVIVVFIATQMLASCGEESASGSGCVGEVTDKYTEYKPGIGIQSGSVTIPTGNTAYYIAIKKSDGNFCAKKLKKNDWLAIQEGEIYD